jgi:hypothetical protein
VTMQPEISTDPAASVRVTARQKEAIESTMQYQPDVHLTPFTRDTHLCIMIRWWDSCPNPGMDWTGDRPC